MEERLQKYLAQCGVASRRKCEELILQGRVQVNGVTVTELGTKINPEKDKIKFDGKDIKQAQKLVYILLNKPIGYVTTADDQFGRDTVLDLVKFKERIVPVGRLDMYTSGALILTNDGDFVYQVTHPKHEIEKTYTVTIKGDVTLNEIEELKIIAGKRFFDKNLQDIFPERDFYLATEVNKFNFVLKVEKDQDGMNYIKRIDIN